MMATTRRGFLAAAAAAGLVAGRGRAADPAAPAFKTTLRRALIRGLPDEGTLAPLKAAGFEGIECTAWDVAPEKAEAARKVAEGLGLRIHSVLKGWEQLDNAAQTDAHVAAVGRALETARLLGADALLLVPCRIGGMAIPKPREFALAFDDEGQLARVVDGDNAPFAAYIDAHNRAAAGCRPAIEKLAPLAGKAGVVVALENVWNNMWVQPAFFAQFVGSFKSKWIQAYLDLGNHRKYAPTEQWVRALGPLIAKCHVKDFKLSPDGNGGSFVDPRDGDVDWPATRRALEEVGYSGWLTIEGSGGMALDEQKRRLDLIIAGA